MLNSDKVIKSKYNNRKQADIFLEWGEHREKKLSNGEAGTLVIKHIRHLKKKYN